MPSFDIVSVTDMQEVDNAVNSSVREISNRYDFKGSKSTITREDKEVTILADDDMKLKAMQDSLKTHFTKRQLDSKALDFSKPEAASGAMVRQKIKIKQGIEQEIAKKITKHIKDSKMKVQASIRGDELRVQGVKRDDLQAAIALIKAMDVECPLQFVNFRD
jgi:cyclic-di-GMP-binding protein